MKLLSTFVLMLVSPLITLAECGCGCLGGCDCVVCPDELQTYKAVYNKVMKEGKPIYITIGEIKIEGFKNGDIVCLYKKGHTVMMVKVPRILN